MIGLRLNGRLACIAVFADKENRKVDILFAGGNCAVGRRGIVSKVELVFQKTLTVACHCRLVFVDAEYFGNVVLVQLKIRHYAELVKALRGHQQNEAYGSDPFHKRKCRPKEGMPHMTEIRKSGRMPDTIQTH